MAQAALETLLGKAIVDEKFRRQVLTDLDGALKSADLKLTAPTLAKLRKSIKEGVFGELAAFAEALDKRTSRGCMGENK